MTINELRSFAASASEGPFLKRPLTPEIAARIVADHEAILQAAVAEAELFEAYEPKDKDHHGEYVKRSFAKQVQFENEEAKATPFPMRSAP